LRHTNRMAYLDLVLQKKVVSGEVFCAYYKKPIPYFFALVQATEKAIRQSAKEAYAVNIYVDGINKKEAKFLTNALRMSGISLPLVKSRRDESEPLIRLADMWAGCMRSALLKQKDARSIILRAKKEKYLIDMTS